MSTKSTHETSTLDARASAKEHQRGHEAGAGDDANPSADAAHRSGKRQRGGKKDKARVGEGTPASNLNEPSEPRGQWPTREGWRPLDAHQLPAATDTKIYAIEETDAEKSKREKAEADGKVEKQDAPSANGAISEYVILVDEDGEDGKGKPKEVARIKFQDGTVEEEGANGITHESLIAIVIDRLSGFQNGGAGDGPTAKALTALHKAAKALQTRAAERQRLGIAGTNARTVSTVRDGVVFPPSKDHPIPAGVVVRR